MTLRHLLVSGLLAMTCASPALASERAIIVLDASGSMWGQIDGTAKIEIARKTLRDVLGKLPTDLELGLIAYGHREKGQCTDIELMVPASAGTAAAISGAVDGIKPKGKTPLADSVLLAAEALKYTEEKATVVLITDGLETCEADPCALGKALEEQGVDFTAHVVGFGLSEEDGREVACLADATGGLYIPAGNEAELVGALNETVAQSAPVQLAQAPDAALDAVDEVEIAKTITVTWDGPGDRHDRVELFDPNASNGDGKVVRNYALRNGDYDARTVRVTLPAIPGPYQLRYRHAPTRSIIATRPIDVTEAEVALLAPDTAPIARMLTIEWVGPGARRDQIEIWDPNALGGDGKRVRNGALHNHDLDNRTVRLAAPAKPGLYELRYWNGRDRQVLASRPIEITAMPVTLAVAGALAVAKPIVVDWTGPGARYDAVHLWDPSARAGQGQKIAEKRLRNDDFDNQQATLPGPGKPGPYELRYYNGDNRVVLAKLPIEIVETPVTLTAPEQIGAADTISVTWDGPGARYDDVQLWDPEAKAGEGKVIASKRLRNDDFDNRTASLPGPAKPGTYLLRYWNGDNKVVMATRPIEVVSADVTLDAPDQIEAARTITVAWDGPGARYDDVQLYDPGADGGAGKVVASKRLRNDDFDNRTASLPGPAKPGAYLLRYWNGANKAVMATRPIEVTASIVALEAQPEVGQAALVKVNWIGPGARYDDVQIFDPQTGKVVRSKRLRNDDFDNRTASLPAPARPGSYELRYWNGDNKTVLATRPLEIVPVPVAIEAPEAVAAETFFRVVWQGPGARYDDVQIYDPATGKVLASRRLRNDDFDNRKARLKAPKRPGAYVLRYYNGDNKAVLAEVPFSVN